MSNTAYIILGKSGDIFSCLPIIQSDPDANLIVSEQYAKAAFGNRVYVYNGEWTDLQGAIKWAKQRFSRVIPLQVYGNNFPIHNSCPNFNIDQYSRAGRLSDWDKLPLVLPRNMEVSARSICDAPFILLADESESSPFPYKQELIELLTLKVSATHKIIRASELKFENVKDFLSIYDAASLIVTVDTVHVHLSAASKTPVLVMASDLRSRWQGSAHSKRFAFYCRYSQFQNRKIELSKTIEMILSGQKGVEIEPFRTTRANGYNLGMVNYNGRTLFLYRHHPDREKWRTEIVVQDGSKTLPLIIGEQFKEHSIEDSKPFYFNKKLYLSYVVSNFPSNPIRSIMGYGALVEDDGFWRIATHIQPNNGANNFNGMQKNWVFFESGERLYAITGSNPAQTSLHLNGNNVITEYKCEPPKWPYGEIRGDVVLPYGNKLIRFFHSRFGDSMEPYSFRYHIGALIMEPTPPFKTIKVSSSPILSGNEIWVPDCPHYKPNVVFPCGAIATTNGFTLSIGINDCRCALVHLREADLNL